MNAPVPPAPRPGEEQQLLPAEVSKSHSAVRCVGVPPPRERRPFDGAIREGRKDRRHRAQQLEVPDEPDPARDVAPFSAAFAAWGPAVQRLWGASGWRDEAAAGMMFGNTEESI
jgi:hypothetical protein